MTHSCERQGNGNDSGSVIVPARNGMPGCETPRRALRVAVIEDDDCLAALLVYNLEAVGCQVACIADGKAAIDHMRDSPPDVVVLDWMLPRLSGIEILRRMRLDGKLQPIPVLMLTGRTARGDRERALAAGAVGFITKPFSVNALVRRIVQLELRQDQRD